MQKDQIFEGPWPCWALRQAEQWEGRAPWVHREDKEASRPTAPAAPTALPVPAPALAEASFSMAISFREAGPGGHWWGQRLEENSEEWGRGCPWCWQRPAPFSSLASPHWHIQLPGVFLLVTVSRPQIAQSEAVSPAARQWLDSVLKVDDGCG